MKHLLLSASFILLTSSICTSQSVACIQNGGSTFDYSGNIHTIIGNATSGDTIILPGATYATTSTVIIDKPLVIIGAGYYPDSTGATGQTVIDFNAPFIGFAIHTGADDFEMHGVEIQGTTRIGTSPNGSTTNVDNILFNRCYLGDVDLGVSVLGTPFSGATNVKFRECIIDHISAFGIAGGCTVDNCIITDDISGASGNFNITNSVLLIPSNFTSGSQNDNITYTNNIVTWGQVVMTLNESSTFIKTLLYLWAPGSLIVGSNASTTGEVIETDISNVFIDAGWNSTYTHNEDFRLPPGPYQTMGVGNQPVGITGGSFPWKVGRMPFNPHWQELFIPGSASNGILNNVFIKAAAQDYSDEVVAVRYWTEQTANPSDMRIHYFDTPNEQFTSDVDLELCHLPVGNHQLNLQLLDDDGQWSSVICCKSIFNDHSGPPNQPDTPFTIDPICQGSTIIFGTLAFSGVTSYTWSVPSGWTYTTPSQVGNTIVATVGPNDGYITVTAHNSCGASVADSVFAMVQTIPDQPATIISSSTLYCVGDVVDFSTPPLPNATSYQWSLPAGWSGNSTTETINATVGANDGTVSVIAENTCGMSMPANLPVTVDDVPEEPTPITPSTLLYCVGDTVDFTTTSVANTTGYIWSLPAGWSGSSTTVSINATIGANDGTVSVVAENACGMSMSADLPVTVVELPTQVPGIELINADSVFSNSQYEFAISGTVSNATGYVWSYLTTGPSGWSGDSTGDTITVVVQAPDTISLCVVAENDCGFGPEICIDVEVYLTVGVRDISNVELQFYPNPANEFVMIDGLGQLKSQVQFEIFSSVGKLVLSKNVQGQSRVQINVVELRAGAYFIKWRSDEYSGIQQLIIER